jgi:hypothetical protein
MSSDGTDLVVLNISTKSITVTRHNMPAGASIEVKVGTEPGDRIEVEVPEGKIWDIGGQIRIAERDAA